MDELCHCRKGLERASRTLLDAIAIHTVFGGLAAGALVLLS
ncbi:MAG: hypothetical protein AAF401_10935 [Pseudomonadota bacterium]